MPWIARLQNIIAPERQNLLDERRGPDDGQRQQHLTPHPAPSPAAPRFSSQLPPALPMASPARNTARMMEKA